MSHVTLPSDKVKAALLAALQDAATDRQAIIDKYKNVKRWSWRRFKWEDHVLTNYEAMSAARETTAKFFYDCWQDEVNDAYKNLGLICNVSDTVNVSAEDFKVIGHFYRA